MATQQAVQQSVSGSPSAESGLAGTVLDTRAEAEAYVASVCFKHGPPRLLGVELEWTVHHAHNPRHALDARTLAAALGDHAPPILAAGSPHRPLPRGGVVTVEPGGQVEISSPPRQSLSLLISDLSHDATTLAALLETSGLRLGGSGTDPHRPPHRLLHTPRYEAMEAAFSPIGSDGLRMMCSTAGVQVCLDTGPREELAERWAALHALGPVLCALFANSGQLHGSRLRWASTRQRVLFRTDPARMRPAAVSADPAASWARRALDAAVICVRRPGDWWDPPEPLRFADWIERGRPRRPTVDDLTFHLSTLFPPVRPRGYLEVRYLDTQVGQGWMEPVALLAALLSDRDTVAAVLEATAPARNRWLGAARHGLADPGLHAAARKVVELGGAAMRATDLPAALAASIPERLEARLGAATHTTGG